jgi:hypothetical protein
LVSCTSFTSVPPVDLSHFRHQVAHFVAIEFGDRRNTVDVPDEVFGCAQKRPELRLAVASTEQVTVRRDDHLDQSGRRPVFTQQTPEDGLEVRADLYRAQFPGATLANLVGITDREFGHVGSPYPTFR